MGSATKQVILDLPAEMVDLAEEAAALKGASVEEHFASLLASEWERRQSVKRRWEALSEDYSEGPRRAGTPPQSTRDIVEEARRVRGEVARDSYP
jgi:hypothetical protein